MTEEDRQEIERIVRKHVGNSVFTIGALVVLGFIFTWIGISMGVKP